MCWQKFLSYHSVLCCSTLTTWALGWRQEVNRVAAYYKGSPPQTSDSPQRNAPGAAPTLPEGEAGAEGVLVPGEAEQVRVFAPSCLYVDVWLHSF